MKMPEFTAEASLYKTSGRYRVSNGGMFQAATTRRVLLAFDTAGEAACSNCLEKCADNLGICVGIAAATAPFCPPCAAAALAECDTQSVTCAGFCHLPGQSCCPELCYPGKCCGRGETCVSELDPNSRYGCCPSGRNVCEGNCCAEGESCCGGQCCPESYFCIDGVCSPFGIFVTTPPPPPPPPTGPICVVPGYEPCQVGPDNWTCCPPGKECCGPRGCQGTCVA
jgi:hypothetical protein